MKLGVIVNPRAGKGVDESLVKDVVEKLGDVVLTGEEDLGEAYFPHAKVLKIKRSFSGKDTTELVKKMDGKVDVIVVFGGDGTASDSASAMPKTPLLCIGVGTTNVGKLITPPDFEPEDLKVVEFDGMYLHETKKIGFNDVVAGNTILTTINGKIIHVDASKFMEGEKIPCKPEKFYGKVTFLEKDSKESSKNISKNVLEGIFGNIFINLTSKEFLGKGGAGGIAISTFVGFPAVISAISEPIVVSNYKKEDLRRIEPITTKTISLDYGEKVKIEANTVISVDGNPQIFGKATVEIKKNVVRVLKPQ